MSVDPATRRSNLRLALILAFVAVGVFGVFVLVNFR